MTKASHFLGKKLVYGLSLTLGLGFLVFSTNGALLPNIPDMLTTGSAATQAGKSAIFLSPYSIGKHQVGISSTWIYMINLSNSTGYIPSTKTGAGINFSCDNTNHVSNKLVSTEKRWKVLSQIKTLNSLQPEGWQNVNTDAANHLTTTGATFWQQILTNATSFFKPAPANIASTASSDNTIKDEVKSKIQTALADLGESSPGLVMACGCANPDGTFSEQQNYPAFPPYREEIYRDTQDPLDPLCNQVQATCNPSTGKFDNITSTGTWYRGSCQLPPQMTETGSCVLKRFLYGVVNNRITYSKVRAAMTGASTKNNDSEMPYAYKYPMGYGEVVSIHYGMNEYKTSFLSPITYEKGILSNTISFPVNNENQHIDTVSEFSLLGVTTGTEGINRGCLPDGTGYWINSSVYSQQLTSKGWLSELPQASRYIGSEASVGDYDSWAGFFEQFSGTREKKIAFAERKNMAEGYLNQRVNRLYGCQAELLPNPDAYCVERVKRNGTSSGFLYLKEYTKDYGGGTTCTDLPLTGTGTIRSQLSKEDMGYNVPRDGSRIIQAATPYLPMEKNGQEVPSQLSNGNSGKILHIYQCKNNTNGQQISKQNYIYPTDGIYAPSTYIFGIPKLGLKNLPCPSNYSYSTTGVIEYTFGGVLNAISHGIRIPLKEGYYLYEVNGITNNNKRSIVAQTAEEMREKLCKREIGQTCTQPYIDYFIGKTVGAQGSDDSNFITKNVCYSMKSCPMTNPAAQFPSVPAGRTGILYDVATAPIGHACSEYARVQSCTIGTPLTGFTSCVGNASCINPEGSNNGGNGLGYYLPTLNGTLPHGWIGTFYSTPSSNNCISHSQQRQCINGELSGDDQYQYSICNTLPPPPTCATGYIRRPNVGCVKTCTYDHECGSSNSSYYSYKCIETLCMVIPNQTTLGGGGGGGGNGGATNGCFLAGTKILMEDGSQKNIETLTAGEKIRTPDKGSSPIVLIDTINYQGDVYSINDEEYFVTPTHPFLTLQGWKAFDPKNAMKEHPNMAITQLQIGDSILTQNNVTRIYKTQRKEEKTKVYSITMEDGHTYYANGYQVHNFSNNILNGMLGGISLSDLLLGDPNEGGWQGDLARYCQELGCTTTQGNSVGCYCGKGYSVGVMTTSGRMTGQYILAPQATSVTLSGGEEITIVPLGNPYIDPGYALSGNTGGDQRTIDIQGDINTNVPGNYAIFFTPFNQFGIAGTISTRIISVKDTIAPTLSFPGGNTVSREIGDFYRDPIYTITDNYWTGGFKVIVNTGALDIQNLGSYIVWYTPVDPSGNTGNSQGLLVQLQDTTPPTLNLSPSVVNLRVGDTFDLNSGVTVSDNYWTGTNKGFVLLERGENNRLFTAASTGSSAFTYIPWAGPNGSTPMLGNEIKRTINVLPAKVIENVIGTYYEDKGQYQYVRYMTGNGTNTVINKTPLGNSLQAVQENLSSVYGISPELPKEGAVPNKINLPLQDNGIYKTIISDGYGRILLATYIKGKERTEILSVSPAFAIINDLYAFLQDTEEVNFDIGQKDKFPTAGELELTIDARGQTFKQLCIEEGKYSIATYVINLEQNKRTLMEFNGSYTERDSFMEYVKSRLGLSTYPTPRIRNNIDDLSIIRPYSAISSVELLGTTPITIEVGTPFQEPGYTLRNAKNILIESNLDNNKIGTYTATYTPIGYDDTKGTPVSRTIKVQDTIAPTITFPKTTHEVNTNFTDNYIVNDNYTPPTSLKVTRVGSVDTSKLGNNTLTYTVEDGAGNTYTTSRTLKVVDTTPPTLALVGGTVSINVGESFIDPGYTFSDNFTSSEIMNDQAHEKIDKDSVNINVPGTYKVYYVGRDDNNNYMNNRVTRTVIVQESVIIEDKNIIGTYFQTEDNRYGFVRYISSGGYNEHINTTPLFDTPEKASTYLLETYGLQEEMKETPLLDTLNLINTDTSRDTIQNLDGTYQEIWYTTDKDGIRILSASGMSFASPEELMDYMRNQEHIIYQIHKTRPTMDSLSITLPSPQQSQELSGTMYQTDDGKMFGWIDFILGDKGVKRVIYKTPLFYTAEEVAIYLNITYTRGIEVPKDITSRTDLMIEDANIYSELLQDTQGKYIQVNYTIQNVDGKEIRTAIGISPAFAKFPELQAYLQKTEGISYPELSQPNTMEKVNINPNNTPGRFYMQLCKEKGMYSIANYIIDTKGVYYLIDFDKESFGTPEALLQYIQKTYGFGYISPTTRHTVDELGFIRM